MNIGITGTTSGIGAELYSILSKEHCVTKINRNQLDLAIPDQVIEFEIGVFDIFINCAGTDSGGKIDFCNHLPHDVEKILSTNLIAPILLTQKALAKNQFCKIVNITSTNNKQYYPHNLAYSLSKKSLHNFTQMLQIEYPDSCVLEVQLGLTKTNFNFNRFKNHKSRYFDIYSNKHLQADYVAEKIISVLFDNSIKFLEISP